MSFDLRSWQVSPNNWHRVNEIFGLLAVQEIPGLKVTASGVLSRTTDVSSSSFGDMVLNYDTDQLDESPAGTLHIQHFHTNATKGTFVGIDTEDGDGPSNTLLGYQAGKSNTAGYNTFIGDSVAPDTVGGFGNVGIGGLVMTNAAGPVARNTAVGYNSQTNLFAKVSYTSATGNTSLGAFCATKLVTGSNNVALGYLALNTCKHGYNNFAIGSAAMRVLDPTERAITKFENLGGGQVKVYTTTTDLSDGDLVHITGTTNYEGNYVEITNVTATTFDYTHAFVADDATGFVTADNEGCHNVAIGVQALRSATLAARNVAIGQYAGHSLTDAVGNIFIGYHAGENETGSNKLYVANSDTANPLIHGDFDAGSVTINGDLTVTGTVIGEQLTSTDDITMQGHLLTLGNDTANDVVMSFKGFTNDGSITFDESLGKFNFGSSDLTTTGSMTGLLALSATTVIANTTLRVGSPGTNVSITANAIRGPEDDDLTIFTQNNHNIILSPNGTGEVTINSALAVTGLGTFVSLDVDTLNLNDNSITDSTGTIRFGDEHLTTTGKGTFDSVEISGINQHNMILGGVPAPSTRTATWFKSDTSGKNVHFELRTFDEDGTDQISCRVYGADDEILIMGWDNANLYYQIQSFASGDGTDKDLHLQTTAYLDQIVLEASTGHVGINTDNPACQLDVAGAIASGTLAVTSANDGTVAVGGINHIFIDASVAAVVINDFTGGVAGQVIHLVVKTPDASNTVTITDTSGNNQELYNHSEANYVFATTERGGFTFICDGSNWYDVSHAKHV